MVLFSKGVIDDLKREITDKTPHIEKLKDDKQTMLFETELVESQLMEENKSLKERIAELIAAIRLPAAVTRAVSSQTHLEHITVNGDSFCQTTLSARDKQATRGSPEFSR